MKTVKRWETYNGDFRKAYEIFESECFSYSCINCHRFKESCRNMIACFVEWLMEEIEVAE